MAMGLEPMWTDLSDMLATRTDNQLLKWKEVAENPRGDNYRSITTLRELVVDLYNKSIKDIVNELSVAVNDELDSRNGDTDMDKKLESRIARLEKLVSKNEWVRKHPDGMKLAKEADKLNDLLIEALGSARNLKEHLDSYTEEANLGFGVPSKEQISKTLNSTINKLEEIMWMFNSSDYYKAFGDEEGFEMNGGWPNFSNN